jgi:NAD(P)-dependent dehydrogenase (short-subunit alcohol dehydrogenase family)
MMSIDLTGQTAAVTGAGRGIGLAVTRALTASGAHVIAGTRHSSAELDQLAAEGTVTTLEVDLAAPGSPAELAALGGDRIAVLDYSAAKAALASFSKALSKEVGPKGIRVNTVRPGPVATDLWLGADG